MTSTPSATGAPRGRRREADRNDERLLVAAHEVFSEAGWNASMTQIAKRAGVGMGSLYRRYNGKVQLAQHLRITGIDRLAADAEAAAAREPTGWQALERFMWLSVEARPGSLLPLIGGRLPVTGEIEDASARLHAAVRALVERARGEGTLRPGVNPTDLLLIIDQLKARLPVAAERGSQLRRRYLQLIMDGLAAGAAALDGPPPEWPELCAMWHAAPDPRHTCPDPAPVAPAAACPRKGE